MLGPSLRMRKKIEYPPPPLEADPEEWGARGPDPHLGNAKPSFLLLAVNNMCIMALKFIILDLKRLVCNYEHSLEKKYFLFKSFVKVELSYVFTINLFTKAENCMEK